MIYSAATVPVNPEGKVELTRDQVTADCMAAQVALDHLLGV